MSVGYQYDDEQTGTQYMINGLLGIINIMGDNFMVCITEKQYVGKLDGANIYKVQNVELLRFYEELSGYQNQSLKTYIEGLKKMLVQGFYFSYNTDISSNRQKNAQSKQNSLGGLQSVWDSCDKRYFWNYNICQDFLDQKVDPRWIVPIIQGYVDYKSCIFDGKELELILISRRRWGQAGTRYLARGLDDDGNVANYVESEQLLCYRNNIYSFVQIRGSVPLFWQQKGISANVSIKRDNELTAQAFDLHLSDMVNDYRLVIFINLLQRARSYEYNLTQSLEQLFNVSHPKCVKYTYYDFHTETKGDNFHRLNDLMIKIEDMLVKKFLYFIEDRNTGQLVQEQKGVMRTNCLDCLDRTNVTQTKITMRIIEKILDRIKLSNRSGLGNQTNNHQQMLGMGDGQNNDGFIFDLIKEMWADNGDILSRQYAGTGSTITNVTKTGKQGIMGKLGQWSKGVQRFYENNVGDGLKHECIKIFLNQHPCQQQYGIKASLESQLQKYQQHYTTWSNIHIEIFTWNCAGNLPSPTFDISNILIPEDQSIIPDLYVIGLQEIVKLNAKSVLQGKDKERVMLWEQIITRSLCKKYKYVRIASKAMVGCYVLLFIRDINKNRINNIRTSRVKTGFGGQSGNKGAVAIRFNFDNSSFAFINCHLTSGQGQVSERLDDIREIYKRSFDCSQKYQDFMIQSHDYKFIFGDLNFRIALPYETVKDEIKKCNFAYLWSKDQLLQSRITSSIINKFSEGELNFDPTYKYDDHSSNYDTSQKKRIPAWCDRILYEKSQKCRGLIELLHYGRKESYFSDHRPVFGLYKMSVCQINQQKKIEIEAQLLDQLFAQNKSTPQSSQPQLQIDPNFMVQQIQQKQTNEASKKFQLNHVQIHDGYVDNNKGETGVIDELLGNLNMNNRQESTSAIDDLLNSNKKSESMHITEASIENLLYLQPNENVKQGHHYNSAKSDVQANDLIDIQMYAHTVPIQQQQQQFQNFGTTEQKPVNYMTGTNQLQQQQQHQLQGLFGEQINQYQGFNTQQQPQRQAQLQQNPQQQNNYNEDPQQLLMELFEQKPSQQPHLTGFDQGLRNLQQQKQPSQLIKEESKNEGKQLIDELFGDRGTDENQLKQQDDQQIQQFFQF